MDVLVVRHADAGDPDRGKWPDDGQRPLSKKGTDEFRTIARHLGSIVPEVELVWASSLVRAQQTAEILSEETGWPKPRRLPALEPGGSAASIFEALRSESELGCIALVGHEPDLHELVAYLLTGEPGALVEMKKGGCALLRFDGRLAPGRATLAWLLPPRVLLGRRPR